MSEPTLAAQLAAAQRALALIHTIDQIRDTQPEPMEMLSRISGALYQELRADLCLLLLRDRETAVTGLKVALQRDGRQEAVARLTAPDVVDQLEAIDAVRALPAADLGGPPQMHLLVTPVIIGQGERLGTLALGREERPFQPDEQQLMTTAEMHVDSAILQAYAAAALQQRIKELETIYHIDHIRDRGLPFEEMLTAVVARLEEILQAEAAFIMLYDYSGANLELRAISRANLLHVAGSVAQLEAAAHDSLQAGRLIVRQSLSEKVRAVMCLPLILNERIIGVLGAVNHPNRDSFTGADQRLLSAIGSQIDTAIFEGLEQKRLRRALGRSVGRRVMDRILANPDMDILQGERRTLTVLYADVRGSTRLAEETEAEQLVQFINNYLSRMTDVILAHEGTLDKFIGDEVMAIFGAPFPQQDHALRAVRAGLAMQAAHEEMLQSWTAQGGQYAPIGVGIATGEGIVGEMGSMHRSDYTVIGRVANLGARICSAAEGGQVLISPDTYALVREQIDAKPVHGMVFKGIGDLLTVYHVQKITGET